MNLRHKYLMSVSTVAVLVAGGAPVALADDSGVNDVIVTGTRETGRKVQDSATPVDVIGKDALAATGGTSVLEALKQTLPSLNTLANGGDLANLIRAFALRGLNPNHTLVLINGKRVHQAAYINQGGPFDTANPVDISLIPVSAIDHIEVLTDGAAAQYGTDAIAGVVNIILKKGDSGGSVSAQGGATGHGDGGKEQVTGDVGSKLGEDGFIRLNFNYEHQDHTNRSALDPRTNNTVRGRITGDPFYDLQSVGFNLEKPINNDITAYAFGNFSHRYAESIQNYRLPSKAPALYPHGFFPFETIDEYDVGTTAGVKGQNLLGWEWDLSTTYGRDAEQINTTHSVNTYLLSLGDPQSVFNDGQLISSQLTTNLDFHRPVNTGLWSAPLNIAVGAEHRYETYQVGAGEWGSYVNGGAQAFPGFTPSSASNSFRNVEAGYLDLSSRITPQWQADLSGRAEYYENTGGALTGKISSRYDFAPWLGVRGSFGNGYHAPTLAQENFATTNVSPDAAQAQLPVTSAGAKLLGAPSLKPEKSENFSVGLVSDPNPRLHATLDAYLININNRIVDTGLLSTPLALEAIARNGNSFPAGTNGSAQFYTNGVNTSTQGVDLNVDYTGDYGNFGLVKWYLNGNYNATKITKIDAPPGALAASGQTALLDPTGISYLTTAAPRDKISIGATWYLDKWEVSLRETRYEHTAEWANPSGDGKHYFRQTVNAAFITYANVRYNITDNWLVDVGANNLFNVEPNTTTLISRASNKAQQYGNWSPYGINGGFYYARLTAKF